MSNTAYMIVSSAGPDILDIYCNSTLVGRITSEGGAGTSNDTYFITSSTMPDITDIYVDGVQVGRLSSA